MIVDELTIILCLFVIFMAIISSIANPFYRCKLKDLKDDRDLDSVSNLPPITVLIATHDNAEELDKNLPIILSQIYEPGFEVIVVAEQGDSDTENVLKKYCNSPQLYTTFIPNSSRYMSKKKLAITLGVKAAKNEWIILTEAFATPQTDKWILSMACHCSEDKNLVIGYSGYNLNSKPYQRFERLYSECYLMKKDINSISYRTNGDNIMFRKNDFDTQKGFQGNLQLIHGEFDFIVNKFARKNKTVLALSSNAWLRDDAPSKTNWFNKHVYYLETRKYLKRSFQIRLRTNIDQMFLYLNFFTILMAVAYSIKNKDLILLAAVLLSLAITIAIHIRSARRIIQFFNERISLWKIFPYEFGILWHKLSYFIHYKAADSSEFTSHKL